MIKGTLKGNEHHPAADSAFLWLLAYLNRRPAHEAALLIESFASCGIEGNRLGEICGESMNRIMQSLPISDRYLLGLVWTIREMEEKTEDAEVRQCLQNHMGPGHSEDVLRWLDAGGFKIVRK